MRLIDADELMMDMLRITTIDGTIPLTTVIDTIWKTPTVKLTGWASVKDRVPEIGTLCLVYDGVQMIVGRHVRHGMWITTGLCRDVTHWIPLPEPPKEEMHA